MAAARGAEPRTFCCCCCLAGNTRADNDTPPHPLPTHQPSQHPFFASPPPKNGGFEDFDISSPSAPPKAPWNTYNSKWGWYTALPGWTANCLKTDWMPYGGRPMVFEVQRGAVATPAEGRQNVELLPNATGVVCQTVDVTPGARYKLSFQYGRLQTYAWRNEYAGQMVKFETAMDVLARDASAPAPLEAAAGDAVKASRVGPYPKDGQGFSKVTTADTLTHGGAQWQRYEAEVTVSPTCTAVALSFSLSPHCFARNARCASAAKVSPGPQNTPPKQHTVKTHPQNMNTQHIRYRARRAASCSSRSPLCGAPRSAAAAARCSTRSACRRREARDLLMRSETC